MIFSGIISSIKFIEYYYTNGVRHRVGAPATIIHDPDGNKCGEWYIENGKQHRLDGPALVERSSNQSYCHEWWYEGEYFFELHDEKTHEEKESWDLLEAQSIDPYNLKEDDWVAIKLMFSKEPS